MAFYFTSSTEKTKLYFRRVSLFEFHSQTFSILSQFSFITCLPLMSFYSLSPKGLFLFLNNFLRSHGWQSRRDITSISFLYSQFFFVFTFVQVWILFFGWDRKHLRFWTLLICTIVAWFNSFKIIQICFSKWSW